MRFSYRSSIHFTGRPRSSDAAVATTYPGYTGTLLPNPPPMSGEMIRMFSSGSPATSANTVRMACGACEVIQMVACPVAGFTSATQPHVSRGAGCERAVGGVLVAGLPVEDVVVGRAFLVRADDRSAGRRGLLGQGRRDRQPHLP